MALPVQAAPQRAQVRRTAQFHPSVWGDYFIKNAPDNKMVSIWKEQAKVLEEEVRRMIISETQKPSGKLKLIDVIQRLGIAYHFEEEIGEVIEQVYSNYDDDEDLYDIALRFRLLRQQGYNVSSDVFDKFKDCKGDFKKHLVNDVQGLLSLHEASYMSVQGEKILDEALEFTKTHLMATQLSSPLPDQVSHALRWPVRRGLPRKEAWQYFSIYQQDREHIEPLLKLAKLDFNIVQKLHHKDMSIITRWWIDLDFTTKLSFARDRVIECSFWALGVFYEPQFVFARQVLSKAVAILSVMDDIYDVHGTIEELELFTEVVERWDISMKDQLPDYMKWYFEALIDFYAEIEAETTKGGRSFCIHYAKEAVKKQVRAYITEARWFNNDYVPTLEEYISNAVISSTYPILITLSFCGMGKFASKDVFDWLFTEPNKLLYTASGLARLIDDIRSHEFEQERGHVASAVECYMKQHSVSKQEAYNELNSIVVNMWKDLNEELLKETGVLPKPILACILNIVRVMDVVYKDEDSYTNSRNSLKDILATFLVNPVPV
ncbi:(+)-delta-cadinene synthase isozyme A, putative [Ricinus communis]|uniref:Probable terpene synthase 3 n=1 Tax=Ricinus communis TaxID=3988 RepID=TPS3_RICCO|nr:RecName: Full=Probable terpene synthase 3; Short=RcSeTPS3 [Ricinus communis]EEF38934.1 (+)-delta-cadinene synthase isozyme A, putative [Ricinus communis]|eukprot:XP_002523475.1 probable terpene synthase 3 [Ricinus communis]